MVSGLGLPGRSPSGDVGDVLDAAAALGIREFDLFKQADRWWHGRDRPEKSLERIFVAYMFSGVAPAWVRQYCREVLAEQAAGRLDPARFGAPLGRSARNRTPGDVRYLLAGLAAALALYALLLVHVGRPGPTPDRTVARLSCEGGGPGLAAIETMAHWAGRGRPPPACSDPAAGLSKENQR